MGEVTFLGAVYMANLKLLTFSNSISYAQIFTTTGSFIAAIIVWLWVNTFKIGVLEHTFMQVFGSPQIYVYFFVISGLALIDWAIHKSVGRSILNRHFIV
jgi:hypothetical protein